MYLIEKYRIAKTIEDMRSEQEKEWDKEVVEIEEVNENENSQDATDA